LIELAGPLIDRGGGAPDRSANPFPRFAGRPPPADGDPGAVAASRGEGSAEDGRDLKVITSVAFGRCAEATTRGEDTFELTFDKVGGKSPPTVVVDSLLTADRKRITLGAPGAKDPALAERGSDPPASSDVVDGVLARPGLACLCTWVKGVKPGRDESFAMPGGGG